MWSAVNDRSGFQLPVSQLGLMESFGLCRGGGGGEEVVRAMMKAS